MAMAWSSTSSKVISRPPAGCGDPHPCPLLKGEGAKAVHTYADEPYLMLLADARHCGTVWDTNRSNTPAHRVGTSTLGEWPMLWKMCRKRWCSGSARYSARM